VNRNPLFFWLRGSDFNRRPLGYEPVPGHHPPPTAVSLSREIAGMGSLAFPPLALLRGPSGHILGTANLEDPILVPARDERSRDHAPR